MYFREIRHYLQKKWGSPFEKSEFRKFPSIDGRGREYMNQNKFEVVTQKTKNISWGTPYVGNEHKQL